MPFLYQPKFCCNCGEKVERESWQPWNSRRFCELCAIEQKHHELFPRVMLGLAVLAGLFGLSAFVRRADPPKAIAGAQPVALKVVPQAVANPPAAASNLNNSTQTAVAIQPVNSRVPVQTLPSQAIAKEPVYYCGAATKKGTPCSRRVKTAGARCWQHIGQPSIAKDASQPQRR